MAIVTLTTDWGTRDHYLAAFKGMLATHCPEVRVVDISNEVDHFDVMQASIILRNCYEKFPPGTIHYIGVSTNESRPKASGYLLVECNGHYFLGYDNGIFSLALDDDAAKTVYQTGVAPSIPEYEARERMVEIIATLFRGVSPETFCLPGPDLKSVRNSIPSFDGDSIRGTVIYIDSFQNILSNIPKALFMKVGAQRGFSVVLRNHECKFKRLMSRYSDAEIGEPVALFNEKGFLEFALNGSNAAGLLGVKVLDNIRIEFRGAIPSPNQTADSPSIAKSAG